MTAISTHNGVRCSSIAAGSQPGTVNSASKINNAAATPSAAASCSSSSDSIASTSSGSGALHGASSTPSSHVAGVGVGVV